MWGLLGPGFSGLGIWLGFGGTGGSQGFGSVWIRVLGGFRVGVWRPLWFRISLGFCLGFRVGVYVV